MPPQGFKDQVEFLASLVGPNPQTFWTGIRSKAIGILPPLNATGTVGSAEGRPYLDTAALNPSYSCFVSDFKFSSATLFFPPIRFSFALCKQVKACLKDPWLHQHLLAHQQLKFQAHFPHWLVKRQHRSTRRWITVRGLAPTLPRFGRDSSPLLQQSFPCAIKKRTWMDAHYFKF